MKGKKSTSLNPQAQEKVFEQIREVEALEVNMADKRGVRRLATSLNFKEMVALMDDLTRFSYYRLLAGPYKEWIDDQKAS